MISGDELISAWETISKFCDEQKDCESCPLVWNCMYRMSCKPLLTFSNEIIRGIEDTPSLFRNYGD